MKKKLHLGCAEIAGIFVIGLLGLIIYLIYLGSWYERVQSAMPEVKQKLVVLNQAVISKIPPPNGVKEIKREAGGVNTPSDYKASTYIGYQINDPELDVQAYYRSMMEQLHWTLLWGGTPQDMYNSTYYSGSACLEISTYRENKNEYSILVFHDFYKQSFSPQLPPMWYVQGIRELGKTNIATCP
jgi:hypothetical protein